MTYENKLQVSFAKEPYKRDNILQKRPIMTSWKRLDENDMWLMKMTCESDLMKMADESHRKSLMKEKMTS